MITSKLMRDNTIAILALGLLLTTSCAPAQSLTGLWGSSLYRVQLSVAGTTVSGTFTSADDPQAPAGTISGAMQPGGRSFTAQWSGPVGPDSGSFQTLLTLSRDGLVLVGYLWTEETEPTSFALHRAINGQVPTLAGAEDADGQPATQPVTTPLPGLPPEPPVAGASHTQCLTNLKELALAMLLYANDHEEHLPEANRWMDQIKPYLKHEACLRCPAAPRLQYGYAMNKALSKVSLADIAEASDMVLLFESDLGTRNAAGDPAAAAQPPRHDGANHCAYVDGYAKRHVPQPGAVASGVPVTPEQPPAATSAVFPTSPFNGMQITYSVAGAMLGDPTDTSGFTTGRTLKGHITGNALTVSGTVRVGGLGAAVTVSVWAGDKKKEERLQVKNQGDEGNPTGFRVTVPVAPGVRTGGFTVNMDGQYTMGGGHRGLFVKGEFLPAAATSGQSSAATMALSSDFTDLTGQLSSAQVTEVRHALNMLTLQHDLKLAVVFSGPLSAAQAGEDAGKHRNQLVTAGMLPAKSGLLLYSSDGARGYSRSPDFDGQVPLALVKQAWEDSASAEGLANRVARQLRRLRELLSASK